MTKKNFFAYGKRVNLNAFLAELLKVANTGFTEVTVSYRSFNDTYSDDNLSDVLSMALSNAYYDSIVFNLCDKEDSKLFK